MSSASLMYVQFTSCVYGARNLKVSIIFLETERSDRPGVFGKVVHIVKKVSLEKPRNCHCAKTRVF